MPDCRTKVIEPALAESRPGAVLRALLERADLSPEQFARRLSQLAADFGLARRIDDKTPYKWLRGAVPRHPWPVLAAQLLTSRLGTPVTAHALGWDNGGPAGRQYLPADAGLALPWTVPGALTAISRVTGQVDLGTVFLPASGAALTASALDWLTAEPAGDPAGTTGLHVGIEQAADIEDITARLRRIYARHGSGPVLPLAQAHARYLTGILRGNSCTAAVGARLHAACAELHHQIGWLSHDAGHPAHAQRHWLAGLRASHAASDRACGAGILASMSALASAVGQPDQAIALARAAQHGYPAASPRAAAVISFATAHAYASAGDAAGCRIATGAARDALARARPAIPEPGWAAWLDDAGAKALAGTARLYLRDWAQAQAHLTAALRDLDPVGRACDTAVTYARLALAHAGQQQPEPACHAANHAAAILTRTVDSARCASYLRQLHDALRPFDDHPAVTAFTSQARTLLSRQPATINWPVTAGFDLSLPKPSDELLS